MVSSKTVIDMIETGRRLKNLAQRNGYTVKDIQKYLCLSCPQPVYRWYKGIILPSVDNLLRISELYHVHMEDLLVKTRNIFCYDVEKNKREKLRKTPQGIFLQISCIRILDYPSNEKF